LALAAIYCFNVGREAAALDRWFLLALAPLALWGSSALLQKICTNDIPGDVSTFWFLIGLLPVTLVVWATQPMKSGLPSSAWLLAVLMGLFLGLGNLTLLAAYAKNGKASVITPMAGLYPLVSVPLAVLWFGERVNAREWIGILLALAAVIALTAEPRREEPNQPPARNADAGAC
jgi:drug/metabolite transporter (DMT)-like permease